MFGSSFWSRFRQGTSQGNVGKASDSAPEEMMDSGTAAGASPSYCDGRADPHMVQAAEAMLFEYVHAVHFHSVGALPELELDGAL